LGEGTVFAWQARYRPRIQTDLCPCSILAVVAIGHTKPERDIMKSVELREVIADMINLLPAVF